MQHHHHRRHENATMTVHTTGQHHFQSDANRIRLKMMLNSGITSSFRLSPELNAAPKNRKLINQKLGIMFRMIQKKKSPIVFTN